MSASSACDAAFDQPFTDACNPGKPLIRHAKASPAMAPVVPVEVPLPELVPVVLVELEVEGELVPLELAEAVPPPVPVDAEPELVMPVDPELTPRVEAPLEELAEVEPEPLELLELELEPLVEPVAPELELEALVEPVAPELELEPLVEPVAPELELEPLAELTLEPALDEVEASKDPLDEVEVPTPLEPEDDGRASLMQTWASQV